MVVFLDWYSKSIAMQLLESKNTQILHVTKFLNIIMVWNKGISFGFFSNYNFSPVFFIIIALIVVGLVLVIMRNMHYILQGMIIGGAIGNIIDRILFGSVFDFIDFHIGNWHYPAFNIADSMIVCSMIIIVAKEILFSSKGKKLS
jgi:signal peptidase II